MNELLSFLCCELDCYLDELKGDRRGDVSRKRKMAVLALVWKNQTTTQIAMLLNKDKSTIRGIIKNSNLADYIEAKELVNKYDMWKNYSQTEKFS